MNPELHELKTIHTACAEYDPKLVRNDNQREAAVSLILRAGRQGAEILFIERARRTDDPWSGQMAFPGGMRDEEDASLHDTAERETFEEIGIRLMRRANIGRLDDLVGHSTGPAPGLVISCFIYELRKPASIMMNDEVQDAIWVPVASLADARMFVERFAPRNYDGEFPGILCGENDSRIIWGLTYRFLCVFFKIAGIRFAGNCQSH